AKDASAPTPPVISTTTTEVLGVAAPSPQEFVNTQLPSPTPVAAVPDVCSVHPDAPAKYVCDTCSNLFCKTCPSSYGGTVKICPFCGAMCRSFAEIEAKAQETYSFQSLASEGFGFSDFGRAIAYPFKFKTSLILGALMFMMFSIGQGVVGFGGIFMMFSALVCFLLANTLTFGVLANTVENFAQGKVDVNFMPTFDDFSLWDDVVHPFFLSIGVYISSFGPLAVVMLIAFFFLVGSVKPEINGKQPEMNGMQSDAARTVAPELPYAANAVQQSEKVKELLNKTKEAQKQRVAAIEEREKTAFEGVEDNREIQPAQSVSSPGFSNSTDSHNPSAIKIPTPSPVQAITTDPDEESFDRTNKMIQDAKKAQLESAVGKTPETIAKERTELIQKFIGYGVIFLLIAGVSLLWGLFYFPAACAVAGYTRSISATLNPLVGLDTIRHLGLDYVKILLMSLVLVIASGFVSGMLGVAFHAFDMPGVGNIPARAIGSLFGFYLSVVFSCVIAFALYKGADRLKLVR
ncbi:MAG TPA: hypothetical protein VHQ01_03985, partial [Pyrinomonadaceae bacterium]|nr:hypothetical protein [Pyrinomonadaceae bacterium]